MPSLASAATRFLAIALVFPFAGACSGSGEDVSVRVARCRSDCEAAKSCSNATSTQKSADCFTICDDLDAANQSGNCYARFDVLYDCIDRHGVCDTTDACASQRQAYADCIADNCSKSPEAGDCGL